MWMVTFDEIGGYDCMTPAYTVERVDSMERIVVDAKDFSWHEDNPGCGINFALHAATLERCEVIATAIAVALNILE